MPILGTALPNLFFLKQQPCRPPVAADGVVYRQRRREKFPWTPWTAFCGGKWPITSSLAEQRARPIDVSQHDLLYRASKPMAPSWRDNWFRSRCGSWQQRFRSTRQKSYIQHWLQQGVVLPWLNRRLPNGNEIQAGALLSCLWSSIDAIVPRPGCEDHNFGSLHPVASPAPARGRFASRSPRN